MTAAGDKDPFVPETQRPEFQVSERQYHAHMAQVKATRAETALPIAVIDTCSLISMLVGQHTNHPATTGKQGNALPRGKDGKDALFMLDWLSDSKAQPPRTLIIPHEVIRELLLLAPTHKGAPQQTVGLVAEERNAQGQVIGPLDINLLPEGRQFRFPEAKLLTEYLMRYDRKPKIAGKDSQLRLYPSIDAMIAAGEVERPKGGIIIVDGGTTPGGAKFKENGVYGSFKRDSQIGDIAIHNITKTIDKALGPRHYPIITHDGGLVSHYTSFDGKAANPNYPFSMTPRAFIKGLHNTGQIDRETEGLLFKELDRTTHKSEFSELRRNDPRWSNSRRSDQTRAFHHWEDSIMEGKAATVATGGTWGEEEKARAAARSATNGSNGVA